LQHWERSHSLLDQINGVYVVPADELAARYPVENYADPQADKLGHIPLEIALVDSPDIFGSSAFGGKCPVGNGRAIFLFDEVKDDGRPDKFIKL
jgi:hypothetical protein